MKLKTLREQYELLLLSQERVSCETRSGTEMVWLVAEGGRSTQRGDPYSDSDTVDCIVRSKREEREILIC